MTLQNLGKDIREQRERAGLSIDDVAARIKVSARTLQAIENGAINSLPHAVYTKGFVRSYAMVIGFDPENLNQRLEDIFPPGALDGPKTDMGPLIKTPSAFGTARRLLALLVVLGFFSGIGLGVWYVLAHFGDDILEYVKKPFSAVTTPAPHEYLAESYKDTVEPAEAAFPGRIVGDNQPAVAVSSNVDMESGFAFAAETTIDHGSVFDSPQGNDTQQAESGTPFLDRQFVFVQANQECWIGSRVDSSSRKEYVTLYPGQVWIFSFKDALELNLGNAGGVAVQHNGKDLGSLGRQQEVRNLRF